MFYYNKRRIVFFLNFKKLYHDLNYYGQKLPRWQALLMDFRHKVCSIRSAKSYDSLTKIYS